MGNFRRISGGINLNLNNYFTFDDDGTYLIIWTINVNDIRCQCDRGTVISLIKEINQSSHILALSGSPQFGNQGAVVTGSTVIEAKTNEKFAFINYSGHEITLNPIDGYNETIVSSITIVRIA